MSQEEYSPARVALITGGSRGIGLGIARALTDEGWRLAINGMRPAADVADALTSLTEKGADVVYVPGNVACETDRQTLIETVRSRFGALHLLVNNAGITSPGRRDVLEAAPDAMDEVFGVNFVGPLFLAQRCARWMLEQRAADPKFRGAIVNMASVSAEIPSVNRGDYCLSRIALSAAGLQWAQRLAADGVKVFEIRPGVTRTDMTKSVTDKYDRLIADGLTAERRWGEAADVGRAVATLVRPGAPYATGSLLLIDGGLTRLRSM